MHRTNSMSLCLSASVLCLLALLSSSPVLAQQTAQGEPQKQVTLDDVRFERVTSNGIKMRVATLGKGPLVLMLHGWPESWYSWRHQMVALANAGYRVAAPDMRGYGESDKPKNVADYDIVQLAGDAAGLVDALGEKRAILVGHDWGSVVAWHSVLLHPEKFRGLIAMSVPYGGRSSAPYIDSLKRTYGDNFFYMLYFQKEGVAEREFDADPRGILSRLYTSPSTPREPPTVTNPKMDAGGWIPRLGKPKRLPAWLTKDDLDYYEKQFRGAGFRGGINYYRNFERSWRLTEKLQGVKVKQPVLFIAGARDVVIRGATAEQLKSQMSNATIDLRGVKLIPDVGHWVQQEAPNETNKAMLEFIQQLK